ncbi:MAG: 50S ribosomal protein L22 [Sedimentisphaerales bacterium]|nr:50S ribosomal protein L22 [Sedimentisphaerales bacterium]
MLSSDKLKRLCNTSGRSISYLAQAITRAGLNPKQAQAAIKNWQAGKLVPEPTTEDIRKLARALEVSSNDLVVWTASHKYAPMAPRKVRLVADLIRGRSVQDALDLLKFANKRAAVMVEKVLSSAVANADEQEADVERLYVCDARVDEGGVRLNTRRWRPKDRGRAVSWTRLASHIHVSVDME